MRRITLILGAFAVAACQRVDTTATTDTSSADDPEPAEDADPPVDPDPDASEDEGTDESGPSSNFIPPTDALSEIPSCDPWDLDSCGPGQKCTGYSPFGSGVWDANRCVPIAEDAKAIGDPCTYDGPFEDGFDNCEQGAVCWDVMLLQGEEVGTCVPICVGDGFSTFHCADDGNYICNLTKASIGLCLPRCSPLADECPVGCSCLGDVAGEGFLCVPNASGGLGEYGVECQYANACNPGLFCADAAFVPGCKGGQGCCTNFCDLGDPSVCAETDTECVPWFEEDMAPEGFENVGACGIPS